MFKQLAFSLCIFSSILYCTDIYYPQDYQAQPVDPKHAMFAVDIHHVLGEPSYTEMVWQLCCPKGLELASKMALYKFFGVKTDLSTKFRDCKGRSSEGLAATFPNDPKMQDTIMHLGNTYNAMPGMHAIISGLKEMAYELVIASDIGPNMYLRARDKGPNGALGSESLKDLLGLFDQAQVVSYGDGNPYFDADHKMHVVPTQKPSAEFFNAFAQHFNPTGSKVIIFIDDKLANVLGATACGWIGIHFKSAAQLRDCLYELGIFAPEEALQD